MFSKALYKQSWKANWIQWLSVAIVSAFILIIIMSISSGDKLGSLTSVFTEAFVTDSLDSEFQKTAINYSNIVDDNLEEFDQAFLDKYLEEIKTNPFVAPSEETVIKAYTYAIEIYQAKLDLTIKNLYPSAQKDDPEYQEIMGLGMFVLNPNNIMGSMYESFEEGSTPEDYDIISIIETIGAEELSDIWTTGEIKEEYYDVIKSSERSAYLSQRSLSGGSIFLAGNLSSDEGKKAIVATLKDFNIDEEIYESYGYTYEKIKKISTSAIVTYNSRLDYELSLIKEEDFSSVEEYQAEIAKIEKELQEDITKTLLVKIPDSLSETLSDMKDYDFYTMTVGNLYYKIVGVLIAIVFVIMVGINLISGQVDSGSMVYILSTGTKRNTITFTQMIFFITSTILLFILSAIISVSSYLVSPPINSVVKVEHVLLFNVGLMLVTITLGAIVFLASCIFNRSKHAAAVGGGFAILTLVFTILGLFATKSTPAMIRMDSLNFFNYISVVTLFDIDSIIAGTNAYIWKFAILIVISVVAYVLGIKVFNKKDLPL